MQAESIVNSIMSSVTYILSEDGYDYVWLVDCGDASKIVEVIGNKRIAGVLLTHAHYDHIYGLPTILDIYPTCVVYTNAAGVEGLGSSRKNFSLYHDDSIEVSQLRTRTVIEGDTISLFNGKYARVFETPGHNPSCVCFVIGNLVFTGDAYIPNEPVVTKLPGGNEQLAEVSKKRIISMTKGLELCPGHINQ